MFVAPISWGGGLPAFDFLFGHVEDRRGFLPSMRRPLSPAVVGTFDFLFDYSNVWSRMGRPDPSDRAMPFGQFPV